MRSRTGSLPRSRCRSIDRSSPPAPRPRWPPGGRGGRRRARPSHRGWRGSRATRGRVGCAGRPWREIARPVLARRGTVGGSSSCAHAARHVPRLAASLLVLVALRPPRAACRRRHPAPHPARSSPASWSSRPVVTVESRGGDASTAHAAPPIWVDTDGTVRSAAKPPTSSGRSRRPSSLPSNGHQTDRLHPRSRAARSPANARRIRRTGVHLRVRGTWRTDGSRPARSTSTTLCRSSWRSRRRSARSCRCRRPDRRPGRRPQRLLLDACPLRRPGGQLRDRDRADGHATTASATPAGETTPPSHPWATSSRAIVYVSVTGGSASRPGRRRRRLERPSTPFPSGRRSSVHAPIQYR